MTFRLVVCLVVATAASTACSPAGNLEAAAQVQPLAGSSPVALAAAAEPAPLRGVPLTGATGLRLLVASDPPFMLNLDSGRIERIGGLDVRDQPVLSVLAVGKDAIVWLDRRAPATKVPAAEIYVVRHGATKAVRLATAWEAAPSADGRAIWLKSFKDGRHCILRELSLAGRERRSPRAVPCSTRLLAAGSAPLLLERRSAVDPSTGRTVIRTSGVLAVAGQFALTDGGSHGPLGITNVRSGERWRLPWPSEIGGAGQGGIDEAVVQASGRLIALGFADPAFGGGGTQVTDVWLLDPTSRRFHHLPDMPAAVALKFTSMSWTDDGRLVWLAETAQRHVVAVWRPGQRRIAIRRVRLPDRNSGSDSFVVWLDARS